MQYLFFCKRPSTYILHPGSIASNFIAYLLCFSQCFWTFLNVQVVFKCKMHCVLWIIWHSNFMQFLILIPLMLCIVAMCL